MAPPADNGLAITIITDPVNGASVVITVILAAVTARDTSPASGHQL